MNLKISIEEDNQLRQEVLGIIKGQSIVATKYAVRKVVDDRIEDIVKKRVDEKLEYFIEKELRHGPMRMEVTDHAKVAAVNCVEKKYLNVYRIMV